MTAQHTSSRPRTDRPWYCLDALVDDYIAYSKDGGDFQMLKTLKIIRSVVVNLGVIAITLYGLWKGYPQWFGTVGLVILGAYNGVDMAEWAALVQAIAEAKQQTQTNDD